jgi:hypothetical protein
MKTAPRTPLLPLAAAAIFAQRPWQQVTVPPLSEVATNFKAPLHEYGAIQPKYLSPEHMSPVKVVAR